MTALKTSAVLVVLIVLGSFVTAGGAVVLNELMPDPASDWSQSDGNEVYGSMEDEWVEVFNSGSEPVDITGWRLRDAVSDSSWRFAFDGVLEPGEFIVIYGNESYHWEDENGYPKYGLSLNNSGDTVALVESDLVTVVDQVSYSGDDVGDDRAYGRVPDGTLNWAHIDGLNPMSPPGTGLLPTPGMPNSGAPVENTDWGSIKALFR